MRYSRSFCELSKLTFESCSVIHRFLLGTRDERHVNWIQRGDRSKHWCTSGNCQSGSLRGDDSDWQELLPIASLLRDFDFHSHALTRTDYEKGQINGYALAVIILFVMPSWFEPHYLILVTECLLSFKPLTSSLLIKYFHSKKRQNSSHVRQSIVVIFIGIIDFITVVIRDDLSIGSAEFIVFPLSRCLTVPNRREENIVTSPIESRILTRDLFRLSSTEDRRSLSTETYCPVVVMLFVGWDVPRYERGSSRVHRGIRCAYFCLPFFFAVQSNGFV